MDLGSGSHGDLRTVKGGCREAKRQDQDRDWPLLEGETVKREMVEWPEGARKLQEYLFFCVRLGWESPGNADRRSRGEGEDEREGGTDMDTPVGMGHEVTQVQARCLLFLRAAGGRGPAGQQAIPESGGGH